MRSWLRVLFPVLDACFILAGVTLGRYAAALLTRADATAALLFHAHASAVVLCAFALGLAAVRGLYRREAVRNLAYTFVRVLSITSLAVLLTLLLTGVLGFGAAPGWWWIVGSWVGAMTGFISSRTVLAVGTSLPIFRAPPSRVLILGANQQGVLLAKELSDAGSAAVVGFLDDYVRPGTNVGHGFRVVGHPSDVSAWIKRLAVEEVVIVGGSLTWESERSLAELAIQGVPGVRVRLAPTLFGLLPVPNRIDRSDPYPLLRMDPMSHARGDLVLKSLIDYAVVGLGMVVSAPVWALLWLRAKRRGCSVLEGEDVLGRAARPFPLLRFNARLTSSPVVARIPALLNIWRRDLTLVGPCPVRIGEIPAHEEWLPYVPSVRPGLTGLWRFVPATDDRRRALDLYYVRTYSIWIDLQILFRTSVHLMKWGLGGRNTLSRWLQDPYAQGAAETGDLFAPATRSDR